MRIIDEKECARVCCAIVKDAEKELVFLSPNCNIPIELLKECKAEKITLVFREKSNTKADMKEKVFKKLSEAIDKLKKEGKDIKFWGRENLNTKCLFSESKAVIGSVSFEYEEKYSDCPNLMTEDEEIYDNPDFDINACIKNPFSMSVLVEPKKSPMDTKIYREIKMCVEKMFDMTYDERPWDVYKYLARKLNDNLTPEEELKIMDIGLPKELEARKKFIEEQYRIRSGEKKATD